MFTYIVLFALMFSSSIIRTNSNLENEIDKIFFYEVRENSDAIIFIGRHSSLAVNTQEYTVYEYFINYDRITKTYNCCKQTGLAIKNQETLQLVTQEVVPETVLEKIKKRLKNQVRTYRSWLKIEHATYTSYSRLL